MRTLTDKYIDTKRKKKYRFHIENYTSAMDVAADCKSRKITSSRFTDKSQKKMNMDFEGVQSYDEALKLLRDGYDADVSVSELKKIASGYSTRFSFENEVWGFAPIVPLALKGVPNSMLNMHLRPAKVKVIDLYYDVAHACYVSANEIIEDGKKILGAVMAIENKGYRVNLYAVQAYTDEDNADVLCVKVKSSDKPFDLKRMAFPLMHPAFFRAIGFDWYSKVPDGVYRSGYGKSMKATFGSEMDAVAKKLFGEHAVYICGDAMRRVTDKNYIENIIMEGAEAV